MAEPILSLLVLSACVSARGVQRLWNVAGGRRIVSPQQVLSLVVGFVVLLIALESPLDGVVNTSLPWHMVQHVLLIAVAPPLLAAGAPLTIALYALPTAGRRRVQPVWRRVLRSQENHYWFGWTAFAFALATLTLGAWHLPVFYEAALRNQWVHSLEHFSFVATSTFFWWMVLGAGRRENRGLGVIAVFVATLPATGLGLLMTLASTSWYASYGTGAAAVRDQQVAGAVMWGFGGVALVVAGATVFAGWLSAMDRADARAGERSLAEPC